VRFSWLGPLRLEGVVAQRAGGRLTAGAVDVHWRLAGTRDPSSHVSAVGVRAARLEQGPLALDWPEASFDILSFDPVARTARLRQQRSGGELALAWSAPREAGAASLALSRLDLAGARVSWENEPLLDPGRWSGKVELSGTGPRFRTAGALRGEGVRIALPRTLGVGEGGYGVTTALAIDWNLVRAEDALEVRHAALRLAGLDLAGRGRVASSTAVDLELSAHGELGAAFRAAGLELPAPLAAARAERLGTAWFDVSLRGPLDRPARLRVTPRLRFESAPEAVEALQFLRGPFRHRPAGDAVVVDLREGAAGFVPLEEVPPLFVKALLLSEDAGFFGHPGLDVAEVPVAWAANVERGTAARGASTITQQLAKNLFLSQERTYGRKLTEAALALVLDAAVPKTRLLEIYLNVIEWGPGLYGLGPAARHYFDKAPAQLTPAETAFLVCVIPSPVRYHHAHTAGRVGPGMAGLMDNLLVKLVAAGALSEDDYTRAVVEGLRFGPEGGSVGTPLSSPGLPASTAPPGPGAR
jgi:hypothetical protein